MFCIQCGTELNEAASFCGKCGASQTQQPSFPQPVEPPQPIMPKRNNRALKWGFLLVSIALFLVVPFVPTVVFRKARGGGLPEYERIVMFQYVYEYFPSRNRVPLLSNVPFSSIFVIAFGLPLVLAIFGVVLLSLKHPGKAIKQTVFIVTIISTAVAMGLMWPVFASVYRNINPSYFPVPGTLIVSAAGYAAAIVIAAKMKKTP